MALSLLICEAIDSEAQCSLQRQSFVIWID